MRNPPIEESLAHDGPPTSGAGWRELIVINMALWLGLAALTAVARLWLGRGLVLHFIAIMIALAFAAVSVFDGLCRRR